MRATIQEREDHGTASPPKPEELLELPQALNRGAVSQEVRDQRERVTIHAETDLLESLRVVSAPLSDEDLVTEVE